MADEKFDNEQTQGGQASSARDSGVRGSGVKDAASEAGPKDSGTSGSGAGGSGSGDGPESKTRAPQGDVNSAEEGGSLNRETPSSPGGGSQGHPGGVGVSEDEEPRGEEAPHGSHDHGASGTDGDQVYEGQAVEGEFDLDALDFEPEVTDPTAELARERDSYLESLQRLQADFDNYKKRVARQQSELGAAGTRNLVIKLLPALDTLTLALAHATSDTGSDEVASVLSQISASFIEVLAKEGLEVIEPMGKRFDPEEAEAVAHDDGDGEPTVTEVFRAGYRWQGQTLRPAMVKVTGS